MNTLDKQYTDLLQDILDNGTSKSDRTGTGTISVFGRQIRHKMSEGFPLLTTKKMAFKTMVTELLWFLRGDTSIKYLVDNNCNIWTGDAYKKYLLETLGECDNKWLKEKDGMNMSTGEKTKVYCQYPKEEFIEQIKTDDEFAKKWGSLGKIYGKQWRSWETTQWGVVSNVRGELVGHSRNKIDQIAKLISDLKTNPDDRGLIVSAWNVGELDQMVLRPCHYGFQVYTRELSLEERIKIETNNKDFINDIINKEWLIDVKQITEETLNDLNVPKRAISLMWNQRSVDTFLGLPFNIASYGLLLEIIAKEVNMIPDELIGNLGDVHLYSNHIEQAKEQIGREMTLEERYNYGLDVLGYEGLLDYGHSQNDDDKILDFLNNCNVPKRTREPFPLPTLKHMKTEAFYKSLSEEQSLYGHLDPKDFQIENYQSHPSIKAPLSN